MYLFNKGLDDFRSPLEELLVVLQNSKKEGATALGYDCLDTFPLCSIEFENFICSLSCDFSLLLL